MFRYTPSKRIPSPNRLLRQNLRFVQSSVHTGKLSRQDEGRKHAKRNDFGVQLLSRKLHPQVFGDVHFPRPPQSYIQIAKDHLKLHGLDPSQGSVLPDTSFNLPKLQGDDISQHFHRIGSEAAEPWLALAKLLSHARTPPKPSEWKIQPGWTKYTIGSDGLPRTECVPFPTTATSPEETLVFDVETMPKYHPYAVMACAASPDAWYAWISPWLLRETDNPEHLIPMGDPSRPRIIVGHNVSYDRARILEEYDVRPGGIRFIDTMALHIAVSGISSHQRPAWHKYRKTKEAENDRRQEAVEAVGTFMESDNISDPDLAHAAERRRRQEEMAESLLLLQSDTGDDTSADVAEISSQRWEEITSANGLADVARLHCGIKVDKAIRDTLIESDRSQILDNITDFLGYCATDVDVTHQVYSAVLPLFLSSCPHPVSFAGILEMGSSFLTVDRQWKSYIERAEGVYREMEDKVQLKLETLAQEAFAMAESEKWKDNPWLSQLDWTPKVAGKSRGIFPPAEPENTSPQQPAWYLHVQSDCFSKAVIDRILPLLLNLKVDGRCLQYSSAEKWHTVHEGKPLSAEIGKGKKTTRILSKGGAKLFKEGRMTSLDDSLALAVCNGESNDDIRQRIQLLAHSILSTPSTIIDEDSFLRQLDWTQVYVDMVDTNAPFKKPKKEKPVKPPAVYWPKWYWDATKPRKDAAPGTLEVTIRNRIAPLLLRLSWAGWPLFYSHEHGWTFRVEGGAKFKTRSSPLSFHDPNDHHLCESTLSGRYIFYKLPHKDGDKANVGNPLAKTFIKYGQDGTLRSPGDEAKEALDLNALCSYWISSRDRIMNQTVVWQDADRSLGLPKAGDQKWGVIIPQVVTMGTVTRRAIEKTWLTASNAKKNRVGSELKAMVKAPPGYAIVGADVDSEELWISSSMGDAQFGAHGASAIGWMTLEGTKAAGTDLHSKTAAILGISRDQAKVFNYSRIYGAGMRHAILLLLQSNPNMRPEDAQRLAENLYASTKGKNTHRTDIFERKLWFGGTESFLFNKLEEIANSDKPQTPALGCQVTYALSKEFLPEGFGSDYMPSRINWVVQSSGVDYLHLLIVSMRHLIHKYDIQARYLISVHDEVRYLVTEKDKYRAALALQIANLWTRTLFAYSLGMDDLPQGVAFFSAVDVDHVLRKEVDMPCVTPSQPTPIPPGESLDIQAVLAKTHGGSLHEDGRPVLPAEETSVVGSLDGYVKPNCLAHRSPNAAFLQAQASTDFGEVKGLAQQVYGKKYSDQAPSKSRKPSNRPPQRNTQRAVDDHWAEIYAIA